MSDGATLIRPTRNYPPVQHSPSRRSTTGKYRALSCLMALRLSDLHAIIPLYKRSPSRRSATGKYRAPSCLMALRLSDLHAIFPLYKRSPSRRSAAGKYRALSCLMALRLSDLLYFYGCRQRFPFMDSENQRPPNNPPFPPLLHHQYCRSLF